MESEGKTYLIYDKATAGLHSFSNVLTIDITIESIFKGKIEPLEGQEALDYYNNMMDDNFKIPSDVPLDIYNFHCFQFNNENVHIVVTLMSANNKLLEEYYNKYGKIPNSEFISDVCKYHKNYMRHTIQHQLSKIQPTDNSMNDINMKTTNIVETALKPNSSCFDPMIDQPPYLKQNLYNYQKRTIQWMVDTEKNHTKLNYSINADSEIKLGNIIYDPYSKTFSPQSNYNSLVFAGGAIIDELGLGKTIESITGSILHPSANISYTRNDNKLYSRATLIICPNNISGQWKREFDLMIDNTSKNLDVKCIFTKTHYKNISYIDLLDADFVIVSFNFLGNKCFVDPFIQNITKSKSYMDSTLYNREIIEKEFNKIRTNVLKNIETSLHENNPVLPIIEWHRIIVDEFHEPYTIDKYAYVKHILNHFSGTYKWCMSATPFNKGSECLSKMLDFVTKRQNTIGDRIYINDNVYNYMNTNFFRRNTKDSKEGENQLKELRERVIWLKFSQTERMMYNAYLTDPNVDKFSIMMRQLCCHPNIADETKGILSNCKTLSDIEKMMVSHYKKNYEDAKLKFDKSSIRILRLKKREIITIYKRQRRFLRKLKYKVTIEYPDFGLGNEEDMSDEEDETIKHLFNDDDNDDSDSDDDGKEEITVNEDNQINIMKLVKQKWDAPPSVILGQIRDNIQTTIVKTAQLKKEMDGKETTYNFFNNVIQRVIKTAKNGSDSDSESNSESDSGSESESDSNDDEEICGICMCPVESKDIGVTKCGHVFDHECLKTMIAQKPNCPVCKTGLTSNQIYLISYEKKVKNPTTEIKDKISLINKVGTKLANLIYYLMSIPDHVIIFSQWDDLLKKVGVVLNDHGIKNCFCRGNVWQRDKALKEFNTKDDVKVIMLSSQSAASGTNLTKATKVILLDPVFGSYTARRNTEWQAVGRAYRTGQKNSVEIVRLVIKDSVEEEIYMMNKKEDSNHNSQIKIEEINDSSLTLSTQKIATIQEQVQKSQKKKELKLEEKNKKVNVKKIKKVEDEDKKNKKQVVKKIKKVDIKK